MKKHWYQAMKHKGPIMVDLTPLGGRVYVGRPNGSKARAHFKLESHEDNGDYPIKILFPENAQTITSSFFLGMFGSSVRKAGSKEEFLKRFEFLASMRIKNEIDDGINDALISN
jgi:hypothetical protein